MDPLNDIHLSNFRQRFLFNFSLQKVIMFCDKCQSILDLDILLSTHDNSKSNGGKARARPHHDTFLAMETAAGEGCEICRMVCSNATGKEVEELKSLTSPDARIYFKFVSPDLLKFCTARDADAAFLRSIRLSPNEGML